MNAGFAGARRHRDLAIADSVVSHRVIGVQDQVQDQLLQLPAITLHARKRLGKSRDHGDAGSLQIPAHQGQHFLHDFIEADRCTGTRRVVDKDASQLTQDPARAPTRRDDVVEDLLQFRHTARSRPLAESACHLRVGQNRRQRLAQLVRQRCRQHAHRHHATGLRQFLTQLLRHLFIELPRSDVSMCDDCALSRTFQGHHGNREPPRLVTLLASILHRAWNRARCCEMTGRGDSQR